MAKARKRSNGTWVIQVSFQGNRTQISLGKITESEANNTASMITRMIEVQKSQTSLPPEVEMWLRSIPDPLAEKLSDGGLIQNQHRRLTIQQLFDLFIERYEASKKVKAGTKTRMKVSLARLPEFAKDVRLREVDSDLLERIENYVLEKWAKATAGRTHGDIIQVGNWAKNRGYVDRNPFHGLSRFESVNEENDRYIDEDTMRHIISVTACPDMRAIFALARFAGCRIPSELMQLKWDHYQRDNKLIMIRKSKKRIDQSDRGLFRACPLWPILDKVLMERWSIWSETASDSELIISPETLRTTATAIRQRARRAIKRAGFEPWPRIWDNMRHSYAQDMRRLFGLEDGAAMTGHTPEVALKNYKRETPDARESVEKAVKFGIFKAE